MSENTNKPVPSLLDFIEVVCQFMVDAYADMGYEYETDEVFKPIITMLDAIDNSK